uniref:Uncharacterized protein n=1 Tax=Arundo donax TaxID=35708 RepID=A0A0A9HD30_ARUDO
MHNQTVQTAGKTTLLVCCNNVTYCQHSTSSR